MIEVPEPLRGLKEHAFEGEYPSIESMSKVDSGFQEQNVGSWNEFRSIWALHNSDVNQHVNVNEYIHLMEGHFARMLWAAKMPVGRHHILHSESLYAKPGFIGQPFGIHAKLFIKGDNTLLLGGFHTVEPDGKLSPRPSVFLRMQGALFS